MRTFAQLAQEALDAARDYRGEAASRLRVISTMTATLADDHAAGGRALDHSHTRMLASEAMEIAILLACGYEQDRAAGGAAPTPVPPRAAYEDGIRVIASNDRPLGEPLGDRRVIEDLVSVQLLATIFGRSVKDIATDVIAWRAARGFCAKEGT